MSQYPPYPPQSPPPQGQYPPYPPQSPPPQGQYAPYPPQTPGASPVPQLPPAIYQQAASYQLGAPLQVYKPNAWSVYVLPVAALLIVLLPLLGLPSDGPASAILAFLILIIVLIIAIIGFISGFNLKVYTFAEGLVRAKGSKIDVIRWDQVEAVWQKIIKHRRYGIPIYTSYLYTVRRRDGTTFKFTGSLQAIKYLGETIQQEVTRRQLPLAIAAYNSGAPVSFEPFVVDKQGISHNRVPIPWHQIDRVGLNRGWVLVYMMGSMLGRFRTRVWRVPNLMVFMQLADYARKQTGRV
ncbi:hypothetical protein ccbrp13_29030 [Ktedonobacteria bacterium brp13]|nr:hypothetical protein ccbrp13_29030 [Ktedonobacteria bacterium brp13]